MKQNLKVLVCGGRDYFDYERVETVLNRIHSLRGISSIIAGGANGADTLAVEWAFRKNVEFHIERADWNRYGKAAGPIRNKVMLAMNPDLVVAFPGGKGTANMVKISRDAGVEVVYAR